MRDDITFRFLGQPYIDHVARFSPDGKYLAVWSESENPDSNAPEDSLRFYVISDLTRFLESPTAMALPTSVWEFTLSSDKEGEIIQDWHWLPDSSGIAFLQRVGDGKQQLVLANLENRNLETLVPAEENVIGFSIADRTHYVYSTSKIQSFDEQNVERQGVAVLGTGRALWNLLFPDNPQSVQLSAHHTAHFMAHVGGKIFEVKDRSGNMITGGVLSPDGKSIVTTLPVPNVPQSWGDLYPFPDPAYQNRIHGGHNTARQYVIVDIASGQIAPLIEAPVANDSGWWWGGGIGGPQWSSDGHSALLPGTFLKRPDGKPSRPCVAVVNVATKAPACVEELKARYQNGSTEPGYHTVMDAWFVEGRADQVKVSYLDHNDESYESTEYVSPDGSKWKILPPKREEATASRGELEIEVQQGISRPPLLVAKHRKTRVSRVIWDPNPSLKNIELGDASVYTWKDEHGHTWRGGLYKPVDYQSGHRYPLVIQTHGFTDQYFLPSGGFTTAFAARELAAQGIMVLQVQGVPEQCHIETKDEISCMVAGYEAAVEQLTADGLIDSSKVGIIGFSRTCSYVIESLVTDHFRLRAASITDGIMADYWQFVLHSGGRGDSTNLIGARPVGEGLQTWFKNSASFSLEKTHTPLMVVGEGKQSLISMWMPYSVLHYLRKPVDLVMLNTDEHVLTNPAARYASQQGSVDWFRFWLQGYEDPDPSKADQYIRWRDARETHDEDKRKASN